MSQMCADDIGLNPAASEQREYTKRKSAIGKKTKNDRNMSIERDIKLENSGKGIL